MKRFRSWLLMGLLLNIVAAGCRSSTAGVSGRDVQADKAAVRDVIYALMSADNIGNIDAVLNCYTDDVLWFPPDQGDVVGKDAVRDRYKLLFEKHEVALEAIVDDVKIADGWATVRGQTKGALRPIGGGITTTVDDKFMAILRREGEAWRIAELIWNRNVARK